MDLEIAYLKYRLGNKEIIGSICNDMKPRLKLMKYYDPKQSRTTDDFSQVAFLATYKAMNSYDSTKGPLAPWIIRIVRSALAAEVKRITRELNPELSFNWTGDDEDSSTDYIEKQIDTNKSYSLIDPYVADKVYEEYLERVKSILRMAVNKRLLQVFNLKLMFPHWKSRDIANKLGVSVAIISQCMSTIQITIKTVASDHSESFSESGL